MDDLPEITSFYAHDSYKGNTERVSTYIFNPDPFFEYWLYGMTYKINAYDYTDFHDWTPEYSENTAIYPQETYVVIDHLNPMFTGPNGKYALNAGTYKVTSVKARGGAWTDYHNPSDSQDEFDVSVQSGTHPVFVLHLVDQNFRDNHNENSWFDNQETQNFKMYDLWLGRTTDLEDEFGIDFESFVLSWSPGTTDLRQLYLYKIIQDAGSLIGKTGSWKDMDGTSCTNHGFDMLFGHVYLKNTYSGTQPKWKGAGYGDPNYAVLMEQSTSGYVIDQKLGTMHETLHLYDCNHVTAIWYIMHPDWSAWVMHANTESTLDSNINWYDGV
ncbi:MAG: hypothetical protein ACFFDT_01865 [Candidatus Hodarchaeota archaeon]